MRKVNASHGVALLLPTCDLVRMSEVGGNRVDRTYYHSHRIPWGYAERVGTSTEKVLPGPVLSWTCAVMIITQLYNENCESQR